MQSSSVITRLVTSPLWGEPTAPVVWESKPTPMWPEKSTDLFEAVARRVVELQKLGARLVDTDIIPSEFGTNSFDIRLVFELRGTLTTVEGTFKPTSIMVDHKLEFSHPRIGDPTPTPKPSPVS